MRHNEIRQAAERTIAYNGKTMASWSLKKEL